MVIDAKYKSLFILPAIGVDILLLIVSLVMLVISNETTAWLGAAVASLPLLFVATQLRFRPKPRTSDNLPLFLFIVASGVMAAGWEQFIEEISGWGSTTVALSAAVLFLFYVYWFSRFGRLDSAHLMVGGKLPNFTLRDVDGKAFDAESLKGRPAVVVFFRGNWCPICMAQIRELADRAEDMEAIGVRVVLVSPQPIEAGSELARKYDVTFRFLVDEGNKLAAELGIAVTHGVPLGVSGLHSRETVLPTVVVTNENGTILYSDQTDNYRVRPEPDIFLAILRRVGAGAS